RAQHERANGSSAGDVGRALGPDSRLQLARSADPPQERTWRGLVGARRLLQLSKAAGAVEAHHPGHERPLLAARCAEPLLVGVARPQACALRAEPGAST